MAQLMNERTLLRQDHQQQEAECLVYVLHAIERHWLCIASARYQKHFLCTASVACASSGIGTAPRGEADQVHNVRGKSSRATGSRLSLTSSNIGARSRSMPLPPEPAAH